MNPRWRCSPRRGPIGLDISPRLIRATQIETTPAGSRIASTLMVRRDDASLPPRQDECNRLLGALRRSGFVGRNIALAVPSEKTISGQFDLPSADEATQTDFARIELGRAARCPPDALELSCWPLPRSTDGSDKTAVLAMGCRHEDAEPLIQGYESVGFEVLALDARAAALARAASQTPTDGRATVLVELEWDGGLLALCDRGVVIYERRLADAALCRFHHELCSKGNLPLRVADHLLRAEPIDGLPRGVARAWREYAASVAAEVRASIDYAARQQLIDAERLVVLLCGEGALLPKIDAELSKLLEADVTCVSPAGFLAGRDTTASHSAAMIAALGLAMFEL